MIERFLQGMDKIMEDPADCTYMTALMPGELDPFDRHFRFSIYLDAELRLAGVGCSEGGGTLYLDDDEDGEDEDQAHGDRADGFAYRRFCVIDIDASDVTRARSLIRLHLPELGAPAGTLLQWDGFEDRYDGAEWQLRRPRTFDELDL